ncbi:carbon-nitrogen hydrolase family protein [soil metagenome]
MNWTLAAVQMDCTLAEPRKNLAAVIERLRIAANAGAKLVVFPECIITGYGYADKASALKIAETVPGPMTDTLANECAALNVFAAVGHLERDGDKLFNACALVGPQGLVSNYRKIHLPCLGIDRFVTPGDRPFEVHDLDGVKVGIGICFDNSFPESVRIMTLMGADIVLQPTNWVPKAIKNATLVARVRAFENHIFYCAVNRVGDESGHHYCGYSSIVDPLGDFLAFAEHDREEILYATFDPTTARNKHIVHCAGEYELDRVNWRRPEMYGRLVN